MRKIIIILLVFAGIKISWADDVELEKIVVTPSRIEQSYDETGRKVEIISSRKIRYLNPKNIAELLDYIPSIKLNDYGALGAQKTISMRGSTASQVLVLVDGRPINSPRSGDVDLSSQSLEHIERIEVLHGPAASMYGSSAMGGVVNIITKQPPRQGQKTEFISSFGTFRAYQEQLSHGTRIKNFGYQINASYQNSQGHRDNSEFNAKDVNSKLVYEFNADNKVTLNAGFYKDKLGTPGSILSPDLSDLQLSRKNYFDLNWDTAPWGNKDIDVSVRAYQNYDRLEFIETPDPLDKTTHTTKTRGLNLKFNQRNLGPCRLVGGFDWIGNFNDSTKTAKHDYIVRAGYIESQFELRESINLNIGGRLDDYSNFGNEISPSADLLYKLGADTKLNFLIARSFRAPTFNDLYWPLADGAEGNPNLQPERGISGEFSIEKSFTKFFNFRVSYFRSNYDKLIKWQMDDDDIFRPKNIDTAIINGVEPELNFMPYKDLNIKIGYTYLRAKDAKTHKYLTYQPKHKAQFYINHKNLFGINIGLHAEFVDRRFDNVANTRYVKRYYLLGINLSKDINKNTNIFLNIYNLLNTTYQYQRNYPLPGLSVRSGVKLAF